MLASYRGRRRPPSVLLYQLLVGRRASSAELDAPDSVSGHLEVAAAVRLHFPRAVGCSRRTSPFARSTEEPCRCRETCVRWPCRSTSSCVGGASTGVRWTSSWTTSSWEVNPYGTWSDHYARGAKHAGGTARSAVVALRGASSDPSRSSAVSSTFSVVGNGGPIARSDRRHSVERLREREDSERDCFIVEPIGISVRQSGRARGWRETLSEEQVQCLSNVGRSADDWSGRPTTTARLQRRYRRYRCSRVLRVQSWRRCRSWACYLFSGPRWAYVSLSGWFAGRGR